MPFNLSGAIAMLASDAVVISRQSNVDAFDTNGRAVARTFANVATGMGSLQPMSGRERKLLPEDDGNSEMWTLWFPRLLATGDKVTHATKGVFLVVRSNDWASNGNYHRATLRKFAKQEPHP